ncbi:MAG: NAD(P)-dependent oxidoreductase, partial [Candidatus Methylomirabilales bacterium]
MVLKQLMERESEGQPIRVGLVGAGRMGTGLVNQIFTIPGMAVVAIADIVEERGLNAFTANGLDRGEILVTGNPGPANDAIRRGKVVASADALLIPQLELDAVVEATGLPEVGARVAYETLLHRKHMVMLNVETDVVLGPLFRRMADAAGVIYTLAAGDQPGVVCEMAEWAMGLGFRIVAAGRGTLMAPPERYATPDDNRAKAEQLGLNPKMFNSFRDGSKAQTESTAIANALGLPPEVRGTHEPFARVQDLARLFRLKKDGGILSWEGVVEMANGVREDGTV